MIIGRAKANGQRATSLGTQRERRARLGTFTVSHARRPRSADVLPARLRLNLLLQLLTLRTSDRSRRTEPPYASYEQSVAGVEGRATHKPEAERLSSYP